MLSAITTSHAALNPARCQRRDHKNWRQPEWSAEVPPLRSAGFPTCRIADFQVGKLAQLLAGWETRDTADLEVCVTPAMTFSRMASSLGSAA
jgi:hypothetical protein